jgi:phospholipid/cholesterol/gamma-HCH transport system substrate-binding protein
VREVKKPLKQRNPAVVGLIGFVVLAVLGLGVYFGPDLPLFSGTKYTAQFSEAAGLKVDDEVRIAGIKVGKVTDVDLEGDHVRVTFRVHDAWIGDRSTAAIKIKTLLGQKYLVLDPLGTQEQDPDTPIGRDRTIAPYDVTEAFQGLASTVGQIDTGQLAQSFRVLSDTFKDSPESVHTALTGLSALSKTISSRDEQLAKLLANTRAVSTTLADRNAQFEALITDGNTLLAEVDKRREAIGQLLQGTKALAQQLIGLVADNQTQLQPALQHLDHVTTVLQRNQDNLGRALALAGPYYRLLTNATGNGHWVDGYLCGLLPVGANTKDCKPPTKVTAPMSGGGR